MNYITISKLLFQKRIGLATEQRFLCMNTDKRGSELTLLHYNLLEVARDRFYGPYRFGISSETMGCLGICET
jgi:hypothetical protein